MLKVELLEYDDLTKDEQEIQPNNGIGKEDANYVKVTSSGNTVAILSDAIEPEDATFRRDFYGVILVIKTAYETGVKHGKIIGGD